MLGQKSLRSVCREGRFSNDHLIKDAPQPIHVASTVNLSASGRLLWTHVGWSADGQPCSGQAFSSGDADRPRDAKIGQQHLILAKQHVLWLEVPVNDPTPMRFTESRGQRLRIGAVLFEVLGETRPCGLMDDVCQGLGDALAPDWRGGVFSRVLEGGEIRVGDPVELVGDPG